MVLLLLLFKLFLLLPFKKFSSVLTAYRELLKEVVKMLSHMNALDHIIAVAAEQGIKDIKQLLEAKP